jgi:putative phosphoribosyl transferase
MFKDRGEAGEKLAIRLEKYRGKKNVLVLAIPRGGVVTGDEVARAIEVPLDIIIIRKIGFPGNPELGIGAVSETGAVVLDQSIISADGISQEYIEETIHEERKEIQRRIEKYRRGESLPELAGMTVILVDDGVATGSTIKAAIQALREEELERLVVAVPVSPPSTAKELTEMADEFVCLDTPRSFGAVGNFYRDFSQVTDEEAVAILEKRKGQ